MITTTTHDSPHNNFSLPPCYLIDNASTILTDIPSPHLPTPPYYHSQSSSHQLPPLSSPHRLHDTRASLLVHPVGQARGIESDRPDGHSPSLFPPPLLLLMFLLLVVAERVFAAASAHSASSSFSGEDTRPPSQQLPSQARLRLRRRRWLRHCLMTIVVVGREKNPIRMELSLYL